MFREMRLTLLAALGKDRLHTCRLTTNESAAGRVFKLAGSLLKTEVECLLFEITQAACKLFSGELADV